MKILDDPIEIFLPNSKVFSHFDYFGQTVTQGPQGSILVRVQGVRTMVSNPYWSLIIISIPSHLKKSLVRTTRLKTLLESHYNFDFHIFLSKICFSSVSY